MYNNQLVNNQSQRLNKDRKLKQYYSIFNDEKHNQVTEQPVEMHSNSMHQIANSYYDNNTMPVNNSKIQMLKLKFNQVNQPNSNILMKSSISDLNDYNNKFNSKISHGNSLASILPNNQYSRPIYNQNNQEAIIEECKQSLNELLKASKWQNSTSPAKIADENLNFNSIESQSSEFYDASYNSMPLENDTLVNNNNNNCYKSSLQLRLKNNDSTGTTHFFSIN